MSRSLTLGVVGLGYVGLPLSIAMTQAGYNVVGVDVDTDRVAALRNGRSYVRDVSDATVDVALERGFQPTTDYEAVSDAAAVSVCVPTPLRKTGRPDVSLVASSAERLARVIPDECVVVVESTVYPGATANLVAPLLENGGKTVGKDVYVAFSPERIDPGNEEYGVTDIPKVIGGVTDECEDQAAALYRTVFEDVVQVGSTTEAEMVKLLENTFRAVNIGLVNELAVVAHELDVDIWRVIDAAATKPFGFLPFYPGPGLGGHCIPVDPLYLSWKADQHDADTEFISLADRINREMPIHVAQRVQDLLADAGPGVAGSDVFVIGVSYKPDVSDTRESPAYDVMARLREKGAELSYHDPHVDTFEVGDRMYESRPLSAAKLSRADCTVVLTDHSQIDFDDVCEHSELVFDTRNATQGWDVPRVHRL